MLRVEVMTDGPKVFVGGFAVETAPSVADLYAVLGSPNRIDAGEQLAPVGHRNNQTHVYDGLGLTFNEHHYTRRAQQLCCWFGTDEPQCRFTPRLPFADQLVFGDVVMPPGGDERAFFAAAPFDFVQFIRGVWSVRLAGVSVHVQTRGRLLPSGRRGRVRQVIAVSVSWPHDNWEAPADAEQSIIVDREPQPS